MPEAKPKPAPFLKNMPPSLTGLLKHRVPQDKGKLAKGHNRMRTRRDFLSKDCPWTLQTDTCSPIHGAQLEMPWTAPGLRTGHQWGPAQFKLGFLVMRASQFPSKTVSGQKTSLVAPHKKAKAITGGVGVWEYKGVWMLQTNWSMEENFAQASACLLLHPMSLQSTP